MTLIILSLIFYFNSFAQTVENNSFNSSELQPLKIEKTDSNKSELPLFIKKFSTAASFAFWDLLIPNKYALSIGIYEDRQNLWELEYTQSVISKGLMMLNLGKMHDERISITRRHFFSDTGSFNLSFGLSYLNFNVHLGSDYLSDVGVVSLPSADVVTLKSLGLNAALGNRWFANDNRLFFGIDWISLHQPISILERSAPFLNNATIEENKSAVNTAVNLASYFPRFVILKLQIGYSF